MGDGEGSRTSNENGVRPVRTDGNAPAEQSMPAADERLVVSLQKDELRRRRRRRRVLGGIAMGITAAIAVGVLLTAGDLEVSDELTPLCLNYLTGVTSAHGPDEAWNEGLAYGSWKGQTMLGASMYTMLLLPELKLDKNPY